MEIGLIDVDGHHFPNLALMRISAYHKGRGDNVEWWLSDFKHYDIVYMSKVFSDTYSADFPEPMNADLIIKGGTGYCIHTVNGREIYESRGAALGDMEKCFPDYSIYPQYDFAVAMTSRGCPNRCSFCHVGPKEGYCAVKVADVSDFWSGQKTIKILDANLTAVKENDKRELFSQYAETGAYLDFTQGLDIRRLNDADIADLNRSKIKEIHFAWDNPRQDLTEHFKRYAEQAEHKQHGYFASVYVLTNFNSTMEENLWRIKTLSSLGYDPYVMIYNKPSAPKEIRRLQGWVNNKRIYKSCKFEDFKGR